MNFSVASMSWSFNHQNVNSDIGQQSRFALVQVSSDKANCDSVIYQPSTFNSALLASIFLHSSTSFKYYLLFTCHTLLCRQAGCCTSSPIFLRSNVCFPSRRCSQPQAHWITRSSLVSSRKNYVPMLLKQYQIKWWKSFGILAFLELGGGFNYFLFSPLPGEMIHFD